MPRIRSLKPEFFSSEQVVSVSIPARYLFEGIWVFGDDDGYIAASPIQLKMKVFPGDAVDVSPLLDELLGAGLVVPVDTDQGPALMVPSFRNHQSPKYPTPTKFTRDGASLTEHSPRTTPHVPKSSPSAHPGESEREERRGEERSDLGIPDDEAKPKKSVRLPATWVPTKEHIDRAKESGVNVIAEADSFRLHAETHDRHAANWNAAFTTWLKKAKPVPVSVAGRGIAKNDEWMYR